MQSSFLKKKKRRKRKESRILTTCASPLRLCSGGSRGPRADHLQDDASEGSPTRISSPESERSEGELNYANVGCGSKTRVTAPAGLRGEAPTSASAGEATASASLLSTHMGGQAGESPGPPRGGCCWQPRRRPPPATRRGSSWTPECRASRAQRTQRKLGQPGRGRDAGLRLLPFHKKAE